MQVAGVWIDSARYASDTLSHEVTETIGLLVTTPNRDVGHSNRINVKGLAR